MPHTVFVGRQAKALLAFPIGYLVAALVIFLVGLALRLYDLGSESLW